MSNTPTGIWGETAPEYHGSGADLLRFVSGVPIRLRLTGPAIKFKKQDGKYRFASMVYVYSGADSVGLKLWLFGWKTQEAVKGLFEMLGDPNGYDLAVVATGEGLKRSYSISGLPPTAMPPEVYGGSQADLQEVVLAIVKPSGKSDATEKTPEEYDPFAD